MREVISLAASMLGSRTLVLSKGFNDVIFMCYGIMVFEGSTTMAL